MSKQSHDPGVRKRKARQSLNSTPGIRAETAAAHRRERKAARSEEIHRRQAIVDAELAAAENRAIEARERAEHNAERDAQAKPAPVPTPPARPSSEGRLCTVDGCNSPARYRTRNGKFAGWRPYCARHS